MRYKYFYVVICASLILAGCASTGSQVSGDSGDSLLVTGAVLHEMNDAGVIDSAQYPLTSLSVKNLSDGRVYSLPLTSGHALATLPAGTYCLNSVSPESYAPLVYCGKPFFKLDSGKIVFTGYFVFAVNLPSHSYTLVNSFVDQQGLANSLTSMEKTALERFVDNYKADSN